jgi:hypothetical protein
VPNPLPPQQSDPPSQSEPPTSIYGVPAGLDRSLGELISPDDWRLYHIMRELGNEDRARVIEFAELLFNLRRAISPEAGRRAGE